MQLHHIFKHEKVQEHLQCLSKREDSYTSSTKNIRGRKRDRGWNNICQNVRVCVSSFFCYIISTQSIHLSQDVRDECKQAARRSFLIHCIIIYLSETQNKDDSKEALCIKIKYNFTWPPHVASLLSQINPGYLVCKTVIYARY